MLEARVAVDLLYLTGRKGGTETYARGLFAALAEVAPGLTFVGITNTEVGDVAPQWFPGPVRRLPISGENRLAWGVAEAAAVGTVARRLRADLLHCPANFGPVLRRLPTVVTVHDLLPLKHPELVSPVIRHGVATLARASARAATRLLTDSQASADDITRLLRVPPQRVDVVPLASSAPSGDVPTTSPATTTRPVVLTTGNRLPHKNFEGLLQAWKQMAPGSRPLLVVPGSHSDDPLRSLVVELGLEADVDLRGWISSAELEGLYASAAAYVCPSLFEGFGLPVLEAMQRGCPVICSDIPVLREVGGEAVRYVDARSPEALAGAVLGVVHDQAERCRLIDAGRQRAGLFTWAATARRTAESYARALNDSGQTP